MLLAGILADDRLTRGSTGSADQKSDLQDSRTTLVHYVRNHAATRMGTPYGTKQSPQIKHNYTVISISDASTEPAKSRRKAGAGRLALWPNTSIQEER